MPAGLLVADTAGNITLSNAQAADILGGVRANVLDPTRHVGAFHPDGRRYTAAESPLSRSIAQGEVVVDEELTYVRPDGTRRVISVSSTPIRDGEGSTFAAALTIHDVTERRRLLAALDEERSRLRTVLAQVPAGVLVAEAPSGRIIMGNTQVEEILGHPYIASENIDQYAGWKGFHADGRPIQPHEWQLARALRGEVVRAEELQYQRGDRRVWIRISAAPVRDAGGAIIGSIVAFFDIDEERRARRAAGRRQQGDPPAHDAGPTATRSSPTAPACSRSSTTCSRTR